MSLFQLPPEILFHVFSFLGSEFFAHDVRRLTVSRTWYDLAWRVLIRDLRLTQSSLERFTDNEALFERASSCMVTIELSLRVGEEPSQSLPTDDLDETCSNVGGVDGSPAQLDSSLAKLAAMLPRCPGIRSINLRARRRRSALRLGLPACLKAAPLADLLSHAQLTSLVLDTAGCDLESPPNSNVHLCRSINSLLPSLRRLRCRMEGICESLLARPPGSTALEEVIINLSLSYLSDYETSCRYPKHCRTGFHGNPTQLISTLETQATTLAASSRSPRTVRIIAHDVPSLDIYAFDAITGRRFWLPNNKEWDAEGELVDETSEGDDETDLFDSDSPVTPEIVW